MHEAVHTKQRHVIALAGFVSVLLALAVVVVTLLAVREQLTKLHTLTSGYAVRVKELTMQTITDTWTSSGTQHSIATTRNAGETTSVWLQRHKDAVDAAKAIWPPDA